VGRPAAAEVPAGRLPDRAAGLTVVPTSLLRGSSPSGAPAIDDDLYGSATLHDSRPLFTRIRDAGPVVWLPRHRMFAMGRFEDVKAALRDDDVFVSRYGVAANPVTNLFGRDTTLFSDGSTHENRRKVLRDTLSPKALKSIEHHIERQAEDVVGGLGLGTDFDVVGDFSRALPVNVVADLVGISGGADQMLRWAAATFNALGPLNLRGLITGPMSLSLVLYTQRLSSERIVSGSWAASVFAARDRGEISTREARSLVIDFVAPSLDTTILAATHLLWELAHNPDVWERIRADPGLIGAAVVENVRLASPIRGFTRYVAHDHDVDGVTLPRGSRVVLLFGAANLDETRFPDPERFDLDRPNNAHLGWGNGAHTCVGIFLAKLELQALLRAMLPDVRVISVHDPKRLRNNTLQGFRALSARFS
jgi:cytochrome P450